MTNMAIMQPWTSETAALNFKIAVHLPEWFFTVFTKQCDKNIQNDFSLKIKKNYIPNHSCACT